MIPFPVRSARVAAITSGKGGVGKTVVSVNLSVALAEMGRQAMLVDADIGLANANIMLGIYANATIEDLLTRECGVPEIVQQGPSGLYVVPGHSGGGGTIRGIASHQRPHLANSFRPYAGMLDHVLVDTATGIAPQALSFAAASDLVVLVLSDEPTAFIDAYAQLRALVHDHDCAAVAVVTNMVVDDRAGARLFAHFQEVVAQSLPVELWHLGSVPRDDSVREAIFRKRSCLEAFPRSRASMAFRRIAATLADHPIAMTAGGHRFFGMEFQHGAH